LEAALEKQQQQQEQLRQQQVQSHKDSKAVVAELEKQV
jgi:hypothetical protein